MPQKKKTLIADAPTDLTPLIEDPETGDAVPEAPPEQLPENTERAPSGNLITRY